MTTKRKNDNDNDFSFSESARDIWLAGLGAFARTQDQGGKIYEGLIKDGEKFQKQTRKGLNDKVVELRGQVDSGVKSLQENASGRIVKLENLFDDRVARVLGRLGIPTADDIQLLTRRVEQLSKEVKALGKGQITDSKKAA
jgi:poly(hydroxyalkanoate) granule-associated protein